MPSAIQFFAIQPLTRAFAVFLFLLFPMAGAPAQAALDCELVVAVAQATVKLRDEGETLRAVLSEMERGELQKALDAKELNLLRQIVRLSYTSEASLRDIHESCQAGEFGLAKPAATTSKPKPKP